MVKQPGVLKFRWTLPALLLVTLSTPLHAQPLSDRYGPVTRRIITAALADTEAYTRLAELVDQFGPRISGSDNLEQAIDWILAQMKKDGLESVHAEPVMVPHWVRGAESARLIEPRPRTLPMLGLGRSVGTPPGGITAEVLVASSFSDLRAHAREARGRIVLFDVPFTTYGETGKYRYYGADSASAAGAVACLIRSVTPFSPETPHTGAMKYGDTVPEIPVAALAIEDAMLLHRLQKLGKRIVVNLSMEARTEPDVPSRNVVAELRGRERPDEVVVIGGHTDSWDVGQGAMDDAGGVVAAWEAVRLLRKLDLRPRRTIRVVGWTNEEYGLRGGKGYREAHLAEIDRIVLAIESDDGVFRPDGFRFAGSDSGYATVREIAPLLASVGSDSIRRADEAGSDISPLVDDGVPGLGLMTDSARYFWYHHSDSDTIDKLDPHELAGCIAAMAAMAFVAADMPGTLPRAASKAQK